MDQAAAAQAAANAAVAAVAANPQILVPKVEIGDGINVAGNNGGPPAAVMNFVNSAAGGAKLTNEIGMVIDEDLGLKPNVNHIDQGDDSLNGSSNTSMENWSEQPTMKVKVRYVRDKRLVQTSGKQ